MILDFNTEVSSAQVLGTGATLSTSSVDLKAAIRQQDLAFLVNISSVSGTTPTIFIEVVGADDAALTSNVVSLSRIDPVIAAAMAAKNVYIDVPAGVKKRYVGLRYTMAGTTPAATVTANAVPEEHLQVDYKDPA